MMKMTIWMDGWVGNLCYDANKDDQVHNPEHAQAAWDDRVRPRPPPTHL